MYWKDLMWEELRRHPLTPYWSVPYVEWIWRQISVCDPAEEGARGTMACWNQSTECGCSVNAVCVCTISCVMIYWSSVDYQACNADIHINSSRVSDLCQEAKILNFRTTVTEVTPKVFVNRYLLSWIQSLKYDLICQTKYNSMCLMDQRRVGGWLSTSGFACYFPGYI